MSSEKHLHIEDHKTVAVVEINIACKCIVNNITF